MIQSLSISNSVVTYYVVVQVFIRTVSKHTEVPEHHTSTGSPSINGSLVHARLLDHDGNAVDSASGGYNVPVLELNMCRVSNTFVNYIVLALLLLFVVFLGAGIGVSSSNSNAGGVVLIFA